MSPIDPINCFKFDTFVLKICCFAKLDMNRKKRSTAIMPFIVNREYPEKKSTVLQILFNCLKCYNVTQARPFLYNFSVVSDVNLLLLTSCKKLDSVFQVCLLRNFFFVKYSYSVHSFFLFLKVRIIGLLRSDRCS